MSAQHYNGHRKRTQHDAPLNARSGHPWIAAPKRGVTRDLEACHTGRFRSGLAPKIAANDENECSTAAALEAMRTRIGRSRSRCKTRKVARAKYCIVPLPTKRDYRSYRAIVRSEARLAIVMSQLFFS